MFIVWNFVIFSRKSSFFLLSTSTSKVWFFYFFFFTWTGVILLDITFSIKKVKSLLLVFPWIQLWIRGNSPHLHSPIQFPFGNFSVFLKKKPWLVIVVHWSYAPPATMDSNLRKWTKGATHSPWLRRGYKTSILMQRVWFWASAKLCFLKNNNLTVVISPTSAQLTLSPRLQAHME